MDIVLRATVTFAALYLLLRLLGKREIGQLTPFELVVIVVMGDLVQQGVTHNDFSLTGSILAIATFAFWALVMSWPLICPHGWRRCLTADLRSSSETAN